MNEPLCGNIFNNLAGVGHCAEFFETISATGNVRIERILSRGQTTPDGQFYDQDWTEYVFVLQGHAKLEIEGTVCELNAGDWRCLLPRGKHRVTQTSVDPPCLWLAIHIGEHGGEKKE